ncbi:MAG TPA: hypothetical protein VGC91_08090 [Pyrinomonadaceae bacterium]|jgi:hypothetical protein
MRHISKFANATRTCVAKLTFEEGGVRQTEDHRVVYHSFSPKVEKEIAEIVAEGNKAKEAGEEVSTLALARQLATIVSDLPDMCEGTPESPQPVKITVELLAVFSGDNLASIFEAIQEDINPSKKSSTEQPVS